jgi:hypothetical protein
MDSTLIRCNASRAGFRVRTSACGPLSEKVRLCWRYASTLEKIEALAPDQSSIDAARKLLKPGGWPNWPAMVASGPGRVPRIECDALPDCDFRVRRRVMACAV